MCGYCCAHCFYGCYPCYCYSVYRYKRVASSTDAVTKMLPRLEQVLFPLVLWLLSTTTATATTTAASAAAPAAISSLIITKPVSGVVTLCVHVTVSVIIFIHHPLTTITINYHYCYFRGRMLFLLRVLETLKNADPTPSPGIVRAASESHSTCMGTACSDQKSFATCTPYRRPPLLRASG